MANINFEFKAESFDASTFVDSIEKLQAVFLEYNFVGYLTEINHGFYGKTKNRFEECDVDLTKEYLVDSKSLYEDGEEYCTFQSASSVIEAWELTTYQQNPTILKIEKIYISARQEEAQIYIICEDVRERGGEYSPLKLRLPEAKFYRELVIEMKWEDIFPIPNESDATEYLIRYLTEAALENAMNFTTNSSCNEMWYDERDMDSPKKKFIKALAVKLGVEPEQEYNWHGYGTTMNRFTRQQLLA
jgi:hypothetical protein